MAAYHKLYQLRRRLGALKPRSYKTAKTNPRRSARRKVLRKRVKTEEGGEEEGEEEVEMEVLGKREEEEEEEEEVAVVEELRDRDDPMCVGFGDWLKMDAFS